MEHGQRRRPPESWISSSPRKFGPPTIFGKASGHALQVAPSSREIHRRGPLVRRMAPDCRRTSPSPEAPESNLRAGLQLLPPSRERLPLLARTEPSFNPTTLFIPRPVCSITPEGGGTRGSSRCPTCAAPEAIAPPI